MKYPTVEMVSAALLHAIVHDHPFHNGNKRTALVAMLVLLDENGFMLTCEEDELFQFVVRLAQHKIVPRGRLLTDREVMQIAKWIHRNSRSVETGDRPVQWRKLAQILRSFACDLTKTSGNRINIERKIEHRSRLGRTRVRSVRTQVKYTDEGREAQVHAIKKIRKDLLLDDENGIDSMHFYQRGGPSPGGFIVKYRKTLKRLARL